ncbi:hypothetical protein DYB38_006307 [Aphanomyces astaci]|uniref:Crinkler effector protein N-terminal domain-containing protein n=1 Tax=Aphanomyces astaci TaxID=112090 RepID=A0A397CYV7_APHAT|nr:hypothetical protein DYB38_006307 [Aphanomyces astaci]
MDVWCLVVGGRRDPFRMSIDTTEPVDQLKHAIRAHPEFGFPTRGLDLYLAIKDHSWLSAEDPDVVALSTPVEGDSVVASYVNADRKMKANKFLSTYFTGGKFPPFDAAERIHVVVVVSPPIRPREDESIVVDSKKAKLITEPRGKVDVALPSPKVFQYDLSTVPVGVLLDTSALSDALKSFGGFPRTLYVRHEMKVVWAILYDNYLVEPVQDVHYVLMGSPGVGKSALLVLFCCFLSQMHNFDIFLARHVICGAGTTSPDVVLCFRGPVVTGYPKIPRGLLPYIEFNLSESCMNTQRYLVVGDGYHQNSFITDGLNIFQSSDLLSTSGQYRLSSQDNRSLVLMSAWTRYDLGALYPTLPIDIFEAQYAYSGGNARDFCRQFSDLYERRMTTLQRLTPATMETLLGRYDDARCQGMDTLTSLYVKDATDRSMYTRPSMWKAIVDSKFALTELVTKADLQVYVNALHLAENSMRGGTLHGIAFGAMLHKLAWLKQLELRGGGLVVSVADECQVMGHWASYGECIEFLKTNTRTHMYWYPAYATFPPIIDSILIVDGVVYYLKTTVAETHALEWGQLREIHEAVISNATNNHRFVYGVVTPVGMSCQIAPRGTPTTGVDMWEAWAGTSGRVQRELRSLRCLHLVG